MYNGHERQERSTLEDGTSGAALQMACFLARDGVGVSRTIGVNSQALRQLG